MPTFVTLSQHDFVTIWLAMLPVCIFLFVRLSGWPSLASRYRARDEFAGQWNPGYGRLGLFQYYHLLIGVSEKGLHLKVGFPPSDWLFPPLVIPWSAMRTVVEETRDLGFGFAADARFYKIQLRDPEAAITLEKSALAGASAYLTDKLSRH